MKIKDIVLRETEITSEPMPGAQQLKVDGKPIGTADQATADIMKQAQEKGTLNLGGDEQQTSEESGEAMTMPTAEFVKGIYSTAAENGMDAPEAEAVKKQMVLAPNGEVDIMATMQKAAQAFQSPEFKQMLADLGELVNQAEAGSATQEDIGRDGTGAFINDVRDAEAEAAMGYGPEGGEEPLDEFLGLGNKSPEEWARTSPQMAKLLQFRAKAVGTPYEKQVEQRIQLLKDRLDMDAGEVAGKGGMPKDPVPPEQFDMKQLREADDALLEKMRMIAGLT
jgi:hypothetical protein